jgi:hypothetical protein
VPFEIHYNAEHDCLFGKFTGRLDRETMQDYAKAVADVETEQPDCRRLLNDLREATLDLGTGQIYQTPLMLLAKGLNPKMRRAIVVPWKDLKDYKFYETTAHNKGFFVKVFTDPEKALEWLTSR